MCLKISYLYVIFVKNKRPDNENSSFTYNDSLGYIALLYDALHRPIRKWVPVPVSDMRKSLEAGMPIQDESSAGAGKYNTAYSDMTYPFSHEERPSSETIPGGEYKMFPEKTVFSCSMQADGKYRVIKYSLQGKIIKADGIARYYSIKKSYDSFGRETSATVTGTGLPVNGIKLEEREFDDRGYPSVFKAAGKYVRSMERNVRGKVSSWTGPFISQTIYYNTFGPGGDKTGKITGKKTVVKGKDRCYDYLYSGDGFLVSAQYSSSASPEDNFTAIYGYDLNGNIKGVTRYGSDVAAQSSSKVEAKISYNGNNMSRISVDDECTAPLETRMKINGIQRPGVYYDANGNLETDNYRSIDWIRYNAIGRPEWISMPYDDIEYGYLADGKKYFEAYHSRDGLSDRQRFLIGGLEYVDGSFDRYVTDYGYIDKHGSFHVYIPDYQGNVIGVIKASTGTLKQFTDYYPYGMPHPDSQGADVNRRKFGGKELSTEFGIDMYDFDARQYSLYIPSFNSPDPLAFKTPHISPYSYCHGDPVNYVDPTGMYATQEEAQADINKFYHEAKAYQDVNTGQWYLALNEDGTAAYSGGGTLTKYFGPATKTLMDLMNGAGKGVSGFSTANGTKDQLIDYAAHKALKGTTSSNLKGVKAVDKAFGKTVGNFSRAVKGAGWLSVVGTAATSYLYLDDYHSRGGDNYSVTIKGYADVVASIVGCIGPWGFALSTLYFAIDLAADGFFIDYSVRRKDR